MTQSFDTTLFWMGTACGISGAFIPVFIKMFLHIFMGETEIEANLRRQKCDLEAELGSISMVDEFAKYAKIKRKLNKVTDELSHQADMRASCAMKTNLISSAVLYTLMFIAMALILWNYRRMPVVVLPENSLYPFGFILSYPSSVPGGISLAAWLFISSTVGKFMATHVKL